jgi:hypothetical protein
MLLSSFLTRYEQFLIDCLRLYFIPLLWSLSWWIPGFIGRRSYRMKWISGFMFLLVAALFMNIQLATDYEYYDGVKDAGIPGYREDEFTQSGIVQFVERNKVIFDPHFPIYSNAPDAVYFITSLPAIQLPQVVFRKKSAIIMNRRTVTSSGLPTWTIRKCPNWILYCRKRICCC